MKALFGGILFLLNPVTEFGRSFKRLIKGFNRICEKRKDNRVKLTLLSLFKFTQTLLHLPHMDGRSAALWTRPVSFSSDPLGRKCADPGAPEKGLEIWYGEFLSREFCSSVVRRESNRCRE